MPEPHRTRPVTANWSVDQECTLRERLMERARTRGVPYQSPERDAFVSDLNPGPGFDMTTRTYEIRGDPQKMFRSLQGGLPAGARLVGDSTQGTIAALGAKLVNYSRVGSQLTVTVYRGIFTYSEADIWRMIERGLKPYL